MTSRRASDAYNLATSGDLGDEVGAFARALRQENLSPNTVAAYGTAVWQLSEFLVAHGRSTDVRRISARDIDEWIAHVLERDKPATARNRFRGAKRFFDWYAATHEWFASPMRRMRPPRLPVYARVMELDQLEDLVDACQGPAFEDRRDTALVRVFFETGATRSEIANLRYSPTDLADRDLDLNQQSVCIPGKGRPERPVRLDDDTVAALDEYIRARADHPHADLPWLWLGKQGQLTDSGVGRTLRSRGMRAGIPDLHRLGHGLWIESAPAKSFTLRGTAIDFEQASLTRGVE
jgi:site-specific recombinase XerD